MDAKKLDSPTVEERLAKLEGRCSALARQNRRLKIVGVVPVALIVALVVVFLTLPKPKTVTAKSFFVVDEDGETRAALTLVETGPTLSLIDENGESCIILTLHEGRPSLSLIDENGESRIILALHERGPGLGLFDENGAPRVGLGLGEYGPGLRFDDADGKKRIALGVINDEARLLFNDNDEQTRMAVSLTEDASATLDFLHENGVLALRQNGTGVSMWDEDGRPRIMLGLVKKRATLSLLDEDIQLRADLGLDERGSPHLELSNKDGEIIWQAPPPDDAPEEAEADGE